MLLTLGVLAAHESLHIYVCRAKKNRHSVNRGGFFVGLVLADVARLDAVGFFFREAHDFFALVAAAIV